MNNNEPIFIVGLPRSGTTLLSAFLSSHSLYCCGPETHFYNKFLDILASKYADSLASNWPQSAMNILYEMHISGRSILDLFNIDKSKLFNLLLSKEATTHSVFSSIMQLFCNSQNKPYWIEKTPNHLVYVERIRKDFPNARFIRLVRDAKDVVRSMQRLPWAYRSEIANACTIADWHDKSADLFAQDSLVNDTKLITLKYEDLIKQPSAVLKTLCQKLSIEFEPEMLSRHQASKLANFDDEPWKKSVLSDIDVSRAYQWKLRPISTEMVLTDVICENYQNDFQYQTARMLEHKTTWQDLALLQVRESTFEGLDTFGDELLQKKFRLVKRENAINYLLFFEASTKTNLKLILKASWYLLRCKGRVYGFKNQKCALFFSIIRRIFVKTL